MKKKEEEGRRNTHTHIVGILVSSVGMHTTGENSPPYSSVRTESPLMSSV